MKNHMKWKTAWSYLPINYNTTIGTVEDITQRTYFRNNLNGEKVKIKFSNLYSKESLVLDKVIIGQKKQNAEFIDEMINITVQGRRRIVIGPGEEFYSDEISWEIEAGTDIVISIYIKEKTNIQSACSTWCAKSWHTLYGINGDFTSGQKLISKRSEDIYPFVQADINKANIVFGISEIKVYTNNEVKIMALFGDSITHMSYYSDALIEQMYKEFPGKITIVNRGIGGNRILHHATFCPEMHGEGKCFGTAGITRFTEDVYGSDSPETVIILEGINDLVHPYAFNYPDEIVSFDEMKRGLEKLISIAREKGSRVYLGTIMPFRCDDMEWFPEAESVRLDLNEWIREQKLADGIVDFAKAVQNPGNPQYMKEGLHSGDGVHPNTDGGKIMAAAIPLKWFEIN